MSDREYTPALFNDAPSKTAEATSSFEEINECQYISKNLGDSGQKETMTCDCPEEWDEEAACNLACGEDSNCINRLTSVECNNRTCACGKDCQNQRFQKRQYAPVKVIQTEKKGYGLVAEHDIPEHLFVYEYTGEVIDEAAFRQRMIDYDRRLLRHFYFMMLTKDAFIDATEKGSLARFCNHSCSPNAYVDKWVVGDKLRMGIFAKRTIATGEEITFDYNVDRYGAQLQPCYCESPNCLGWMGGKTQTDAALLLPDGISEALGVTRQQEKAWLKQNKLTRANQQSPDAVVNEEFVRSLTVAPLVDSDVTKAMSALMKVEEHSIVAKLIERLFITDDPKTNALIVKLHGYKTLSKVLKEHGATDDDLTFKVLLVLKRWPSMTRNKIELSQIEAEVNAIYKELKHPETKELAAGLIEEWGKLEMAYRIPKNNDNGNNEVKRSMSPLFGRNPRSELPAQPIAADESGVNLNDEEELPEGWQKALDTNTNTVYYYHTGLGISKWEKPTMAIPKGPKVGTPKAPKAPSKQKKNERPRPQKRQDEKDLTRLQEQRLQQMKEEQFKEVREKEKLLQELIIQSQKDVEEKKRLAEKLKQERIEKHKERKRKREAAAAHSKSKSSNPVEQVSPEVAWTKTLAKYIPNMIKKHEAEIGHENIKGCARDLVKIIAAKEARKQDGKPPRELDNAKLAKLKAFSNSFMEKFLDKYRSKRVKHNGGEQ
ncbi:CIC11C00000001660 [Sungouiella intermedia]|uniref:Histone-lysine N-methyltransferase, H3 lysine-36 specific n=1 Tax=Sungouiella intermedia TaxID=45354 RepID=A0A1L0BZF3_9ASCO|nr:CIC11C00000001660 [[Candida] intermedia]